MRRRRCSLVVAVVAAGLSAAGRPLPAQDTEGGLWLLVPIGAHAVGKGQAVVADAVGSEAVWWNPAGLARATRREAAIHHSDSFLGEGDAVALVIPSSLLGVISASVNILNFGEQELTVDPGGTVGTVLVRSFLFSGTYATPIGDRLNAGITYKVVQFRFDCSGPCTDPPSIPTTSAIDIGAQYNLSPTAPVWIGVLLRNLGPRLQVFDNEQADPVPTRLHLGMRYRYDRFSGAAEDATVQVSAEVADELSFKSPSTYYGVELAWQNRVFFRSGYAHEQSENSGVSLGFGLSLGSLVLDVARMFEGFSADAGQAPTYLSLRYLF